MKSFVALSQINTVKKKDVKFIQIFGEWKSSLLATVFYIAASSASPYMTQKITNVMSVECSPILISS